jgi:hypothetical protein
VYLILLDYNITLGLDTLFIGYFCCSRLLIFVYVLFWLFFVLSCIAIWHNMNIYVTIYRKVTHFRRFVSFDNISRYFDRFIYQWLWYDLKKSELEMLSLKVVTGWKKCTFSWFHIFLCPERSFNYLENSLGQSDFGFIFCIVSNILNIDIIPSV